MTQSVDGAVSSSRKLPTGSSINHPVNLVPHDKTTLIATSSISYRVLLSHNVLHLSDGNDIMLVVNKQSHGFEKSIVNYLSNEELTNHTTTQDGDCKYKLRMRICVFSLREKLPTNLVDENEQILRYNQVNGMTLRSVQYPQMKYLVCFKDIVSGEIQLYDQFSPSFEYPNFFSAAGCIKDPRVYVPIYKSYLRVVHGAS